MIDENNPIVDEEPYNEKHQQVIPPQYSKIQPIWHFIILSFFSLGWYQFVWTYKRWHFIKARFQLKISPAKRTFFSLFFLYSLFKRIYIIAKENGYEKKTPISVLFLAAIIIPFLSFLPKPYWLISSLSFIPYIPIVKMLNYIYEKDQPNFVVQKKLSRGQKIFLILSIVYFALATIGSFFN
jgi:hypothetical protein